MRDADPGQRSVASWRWPGAGPLAPGLVASAGGQVPVLGRLPCRTRPPLLPTARSRATALATWSLFFFFRTAADSRELMGVLIHRLI